MGNYLEKGAQAVIDMQEELRRQALKVFSGFPYAAGGDEGAQVPAKPAPKAKATTPRKPRPKKK